jgi:3',5'-cyclic AMP phosphodiesterase CpdA
MSASPNEKWIYTYSYAPDEVWESWRDKIDVMDWMEGEVERVVKQVRKLRRNGDAALLLLADTHYNVNGTWDDTRECLRRLQSAVGFDGIVHLGDFTDGMISAAKTKEYVGQVLEDLKRLDVPLYLCLGNHDCNYFMDNPQRLSLQEQRDLYLDGHEAHYEADFPEYGLRLMFLDSFDPDAQLRYGYSGECIDFLDDVLAKLNNEYSAIIFSHLPPLAKLQYWAANIRGEAGIMSILRKNSGKILAYINGHNHADLIGNEEKFPIISIANAKCEAYLERKPEGFITPERKLGTRIQECFDIMLINSGIREIRFIRFGSGRDKMVSCGKAKWI